jgi:hypothetical protein
MANRYWVGGSGTWNTSNTANWSATSGGSGGASAPVLADSVFFNGSSGGGTVTISGTVDCWDITDTGFTGNFAHSSGILQINRTTGFTIATLTSSDTALPSGLTIKVVGFTANTQRRLLLRNTISNPINLYATAGGTGVNNTIEIPATYTTYFNVVDSTGYYGNFGLGGALYVLQSFTLQAGANASSASVYTSPTSGTCYIQTNGTSLGSLGVGGSSGTTTEILNNSNISVVTAYVANTTFKTNNYNISGLQFNVASCTANLGTSTITVTDSYVNPSSATFTTSTWTLVLNQISNTVESYIWGTNTIPNVVFAGNGSAPIRFYFSTSITNASTTRTANGNFKMADTPYQITVQNFNLSGSPGIINTFNSTTSGTQWNIRRSSGTVYLDYISLTDSNAGGGAVFAYGPNSSYLTNNSGWIASVSTSTNLTGLVGTTALGTVSVTTTVGSYIYVTGVLGTAELGTLSFITNNFINVSGLLAVGQVGNASTDVFFDAIGLSATAILGDGSTNETIAVSGVFGNGLVNDVGAVIWTNVITSGNGTLY